MKLLQVLFIAITTTFILSTESIAQAKPEALAPAPVAAPAQPPKKIELGAPITQEIAKKVVAAAIAEARKNNWDMGFAIFDTGGNLVYFERMDGTRPSVADAAIAKARSAALFRTPTQSFQERLEKGALGILKLPNAIPLGGGILIMVDGKMVGPIGASGGSSEQDAQAASAGAAAVK